MVIDVTAELKCNSCRNNFDHLFRADVDLAPMGHNRQGEINLAFTLDKARLDRQVEELRCPSCESPDLHLVLTR